MTFSRTVYAAIYAGALAIAMCAAPAASAQVLQNHVPRAVRESRRLGPLAETANLNLAIGLPLRNSEELDRVVAQISDPRSAGYRQYLSASEFAERFGPTQEDYDRLIGYLEQKGFVVTGKHANRMILDVTGSVGAINKTLHISLTAFDHPARGRFFAPDRDPSLDNEIQVLDIAGLDNFVLPAPMDLKSIPLASAIPFVSGSGPSGLFVGNDFRAAYAPGVTLTGAGQTIGLVEFDGFYAADVVSNFKQAGLTPVSVQTVLLDGFNGSPGSANIEVILDIVMAGYMAPGAKVIVYEGNYPNDVLNRMATDNIAKQLSCSWGYGINSTTEQIFKQMIAQGQSFFTASGDSGAYSGGVMPPADDPNVTSVGGSALSTTGPGGTWLAESALNGSGGGVSTTYAIPSYQQSMNMAAHGGSNSMRNLPDVALTGAVQMYLIYNNGQQTAVGGTSAATPLWGAFTALANQQAAANGKPVIGFLNPAIYAIGNGSGYGAALHDITTGSNGFSAIAGFDLATGWGTPSGQPLINDLSSMSSPSFTLSATPNPASVQAGSSATSSIQVTAQNGFSAAVSLSLAGLPAGVTGTFGAFNAGASILTLAAASAAVPGNYTISVQGVSGALTSSVQLALAVTGTPGFSLKSSVAAVSVVQGATGTASITVSPVNGFTAAVALTVSGLPSGVTASFSPASTTAASALSLVASSSAAAGTANLTVTGKSGTLSATVAIALTVTVPPAFSLTASAPTLSVAQGSSAASTITVVVKTGFSGKVELTASGLPAGVSASFNPASTATTSVATFSATSAATLGTGAVTVTGASGTSSTSVTLSLTVKPGPSFTLAAAPAVLSVTQGGTGTSVVTVTPLNGFTGAAALAIGALPAGVTASFTPASTASTSTLKLTASTAALLGPATVTITATSGAISSQASIALTVAAAPSFKLSSGVANLNVAPGGAGTAAITVLPQAGFSGAVALTATGLPTGVTASFTPASTTTTSSLKLTATAGAAVKVSQFTINGTSGSLSASVAITVTVTPPPDFAILLAPASLRVVPGGKGSTAISLAPLNGFTGTVTMSASGLPAGITASFTALNSGLILGVFTVGGSAIAGTSQVTLTASAGSMAHAVVLILTIVAPSAGSATVDLSPSYNVPASAIDNLPFTTGGLDALGRSYSGVLLGASQSIGGTLFGLGPMGLPDAVSGQAITLPAGQFTALKILATGVNGNQPGQTFTVTYTDGTTAAFTQSLSDWYTPQNYPGESQALATYYRDNSTGTTDGRAFYLYGYSFNLNGAKTVRSIALPPNRNVVALAITLTGGANVTPAAQVDLSKAFNGVGITSDGKPFSGGLDGIGNAYSGSLVKGALAANNVLFQPAAPDQSNVVSGAAAITLPAGKYSSLLLLATAVNGAQLSQQFKVIYSDGTSATFTQSLSDWFVPNNFAGELTALAMPYRNAANGTKDNRPFALYTYTFSLNNTKTVSSVTLPSNTNVKVFAIDLKP
jgi:Pro-kumamolisin, activation domain